MVKCKVIIILGLAVSCFGLHLPNYIKTCSRNDLNLNECALKNARLAFPYIVEGDKNFHVPNLKPLVLPLIQIITPNLNINFTNVNIRGIANAEMQNFKIDLKQQNVEATIFNTINTDADYEIDGKILILTIAGKGKANFTFENTTFVYRTSYNLTNIDGKQYSRFYNSELDYKMDKAHLYFENLFNGDERLGPEMNKFLNEHWEQVMKDVGEGFTGAVKDVTELVFKNYLEHVPYDEILPK